MTTLKTILKQKLEAIRDVRPEDIEKGGDLWLLLVAGEFEARFDPLLLDVGSGISLTQRLFEGKNWFSYTPEVDTTFIHYAASIGFSFEYRSDGKPRSRLTAEAFVRRYDSANREAFIQNRVVRRLNNYEAATEGICQLMCHFSQKVDSLNSGDTP